MATVSELQKENNHLKKMINRYNFIENFYDNKKYFSIAKTQINRSHKFLIFDVIFDTKIVNVKIWPEKHIVNINFNEIDIKNQKNIIDFEVFQYFNNFNKKIDDEFCFKLLIVIEKYYFTDNLNYEIAQLFEK